MEEKYNFKERETKQANKKNEPRRGMHWRGGRCHLHSCLKGSESATCGGSLSVLGKQGWGRQVRGLRKPLPHNTALGSVELTLMPGKAWRHPQCSTTWPSAAAAPPNTLSFLKHLLDPRILYFPCFFLLPSFMATLRVLFFFLTFVMKIFQSCIQGEKIEQQSPCVHHQASTAVNS